MLRIKDNMEKSRERLIRTEMLFGHDAMEKIKNSRVIVFGVGGVGGYVCEALARSGVMYIDIVDKDKVSVSNLNRQIIATEKTIGCDKVDVMKERINDINPEAKVNAHKCFFLPENADEFDFNEYDYVIDCVDTVTAKIEIIMRSKAAGVPVISAMGTGNKIDPSKLVITDIYKTKTCPLARVMRKELKARNVDSLKVCYSVENPMKPDAAGVLDDPDITPRTPGSTAFVPPAAGLLIASEVIRDICKKIS